MTAPDGSPEFWVDRFIRSLGEKTSLAFAFAVGLTSYEVVLRYFFNAPTTWVHETTIALTATAFIVGGSYTLQRNAHIRITLVFDAMPALLRRWLNVVNLAIVVYYLIALAYGASIQARKSLAVMERTGTASDLPLPVILKSFLAIGVGLMALQAALQLWRSLRGRV